MIGYAKLLFGGALMGLGAFLLYVTYASPKIEDLKAQIAQIQSNDAKATAKFLKDAKNETDALIADRDRIAAQYQADQAKSAAANAVLSATARGLRNTIATYASRNVAGLPQTTVAQCPVDDRAQVLGRLLSESTDLLAEGAEIVKSDADQIRALQGHE